MFLLLHLKFVEHLLDLVIKLNNVLDLLLLVLEIKMDLLKLLALDYLFEELLSLIMM